MRVNDLVGQITDPQLRQATLACMSILAGGDLERDFQRCQKTSVAMLWEFKREVSPGLLLAFVINLVAGARKQGQDDRLIKRLFQIILGDPGLIDLLIQVVSYAELLAPAAKREAERFIAEMNKKP
jgi:hypothetical protein